MRVSLVVIFNHRYDKNVERLQTRLSDRFEAITFLCPFSEVVSPSVVKIYEASMAFSSHIAQGYERFRDDSASHYLFIADDLLLNPAINQDNVLSWLNAGPQDAYTKNIARLEDAYYVWLQRTRVLLSLRSAGFDFLSLLPSVEMAERRLVKLGLPPRKLGWRSLRHWNGRWNFREVASRPRTVWECLRAASRPLPYPLAFGYSDMVLVPAASMAKFADYCGVFGAMNLFAEVAVPTALALACDSIRTELEIGEIFQKSNRRRAGQTRYGREIWGQYDIERFESSHARKLDKLEQSLPSDCLYVHPIKLSRWQ